MNAGSPKLNLWGPLASSVNGCVTAAAVVVISTAPALAAENPADSHADRQMRLSASTNERELFGAEREWNAASPRHNLTADVASQDAEPGSEDRLKLFYSVRNMLAGLEATPSTKAARRLLDDLKKALPRIDVPVGAPPLAGTFRDDGSVLIEWALPDRRLTFSVEANLAESNWTFAKLSGDLACGDLAGAPLVSVLGMFVGTDPA